MIRIGGRKRQIDAESQSNLEECLLQSGVSDAKAVKIWNKARKGIGKEKDSDMAVTGASKRNAYSRRKVVLLSTRWKQTQKNGVPFCFRGSTCCYN